MESTRDFLSHKMKEMKKKCNYYSINNATKMTEDGGDGEKVGIMTTVKALLSCVPVSCSTIQKERSAAQKDRKWSGRYLVE